MTEPVAQPQPGLTENPSPADIKTSKSGGTKKFLVTTPWHCDQLIGEGFPTVTPNGTEMNEKEAEAAIAVANSLYLRLSVEEAS